MEGSGLRLAVWNCSGGLPRKHSVLRHLQPDIAVVPEASEDFARGLPGASSLWIGSKAARGLGVIALNGWIIEPLEAKLNERLFLPCVATRGTDRVQLIGVCAKKAADYVSPTLGTLQALEHFISEAPTILAGDFNASVSFERPVPFRLVIDRLDRLGMASAWHRFRGETFGAETAPTFFMNWSDHPGKGFHIDYAFVPKSFILDGVRIGSHSEYAASGLSDHAPLTVDLHLPAR